MFPRMQLLISVQRGSYNIMSYFLEVFFIILYLYFEYQELFSLIPHPSVLRDIRRIAQTIGEVFVGISGAEDGDALHGKDIAVPIDVAVFDGKSAFIPRLLRDLRDVEVVDARGVGNKFDRMSEFAFGMFFRFDEFLSDTVVGEFGQRRVCDSMGLYGDAVLFHFAELIPCEVSFAFAEESGDNEDGGFEVVFFEDGIGGRIVIDVAVVERDEDGAFGEFPRAREEVIEFVWGDGMIAVVDKVFHLPVEVVGFSGKRDKHRVDHMVVENEHLCVVRREHRCRFGIILRFRKEEQRTEEDGKDGNDRPNLPSANDFFQIHAVPPLPVFIVLRFEREIKGAAS